RGVRDVPQLRRRRRLVRQHGARGVGRRSRPRVALCERRRQEAAGAGAPEQDRGAAAGPPRAEGPAVVQVRGALPPDLGRAEARRATGRDGLRNRDGTGTPASEHFDGGAAALGLPGTGYWFPVLVFNHSSICWAFARVGFAAWRILRSSSQAS